MQLPETCWNIFVEVLKKISSKSQTIRKIIYILSNSKKNGFSPNVSLEPQIAFLTSLPKSLHQKLNRFLRINSREDEEKYTFFRKDPQNFPLETSNAVLTSLPKVFRQKLDNFLLIFRRWWKVVQHFQKTLLEIFTGNLEFSFDNPVENFLSKLQKFSTKLTRCW